MEEMETVFSGQCFRPLPALTPARSGCGGFPCRVKRPQAGAGLRALCAGSGSGSEGVHLRLFRGGTDCGSAVRKAEHGHPVVVRMARPAPHGPVGLHPSGVRGRKNGRAAVQITAARPSGSVQVISGSGSCTSGISSWSMMVSISSIFSHSAGVNRFRMRSITARR